MTNWTNIEVKRLQAMWSVASMGDLAAALPRHKPASINAYAYKLGLRRPVRNTANKTHPLMAQLRARRLARGLSQDVVAERAGFYRGSLSRFENGCGLPNFKILERWCLVFDAELTFVEVA